MLSVEKDPKFLPVLQNIKKDFPENFRFEIADALEYDFQGFFAELQWSPPKIGGVPPTSRGGGGISKLTTPPSPTARPLPGSGPGQALFQEERLQLRGLSFFRISNLTLSRALPNLVGTWSATRRQLDIGVWTRLI